MVFKEGTFHGELPEHFNGPHPALLETAVADALAAAGALVQEKLPGQPMPDEAHLVTLLAYYQFLRSHKQADGFLDLARAREFGRHLAEA